MNIKSSLQILLFADLILHLQVLNFIHSVNYVKKKTNTTACSIDRMKHLFFSYRTKQRLKKRAMLQMCVPLAASFGTKP